MLRLRAPRPVSPLCVAAPGLGALTVGARRAGPVRTCVRAACVLTSVTRIFAADVTARWPRLPLGRASIAASVLIFGSSPPLAHSQSEQLQRDDTTYLAHGRRNRSRFG